MPVGPDARLKRPPRKPYKPRSHPYPNTSKNKAKSQIGQELVTRLRARSLFISLVLQAARPRPYDGHCSTLDRTCRWGTDRIGGIFADQLL